MKLNKNLGRIATTFLATAMLASVSAVPAFADENDVITGSNNTITINKVIDMTTAAEKAGIPDATFKFTIGAGQAAEGIKAGDMDAITNVDADPAMEGKQVTVSTATTEDDQTVYVADLDIDLTFNTTEFADTGAGIYRYTFKEEDCGVAGMSIDNKSYTLDVTVVNGETDGTYVIKYAELYSDSADKNSSKTNTITNTYYTYDLALDKQVTGLLGDKTKDFSFTVVFTNHDKSANSFQWAYDAETPEYKTENFDENGTATVTVSLKHGAKVNFKGLPEDVTYVITEAQDSNYVASATGAGVDSNVADETPANDKDKKVVNGDVKVENKAQDVSVTYTNVNANDDTPATGIAMNIAPYALLVVAAAAGCFVFLRKRRED